MSLDTEFKADGARRMSPATSQPTELELRAMWGRLALVTDESIARAMHTFALLSSPYSA